MGDPAKILQDNEIIQETGILGRFEGEHAVVRTSSGDYRAKRATSCLLEPEEGDFVLVSTIPGGRCYVLAVLERPDGKSAQLSVDGDLAIRLKSGRFAVAAQNGMSLASGKDISMVAGELSVNAVDGNVALQRLSYVGRFLRSEVEKIKTFAGTLDTVMDRFSQKVKRSYRTVEEFDQLRAERIDYVANKTMSLHAANALMTAKQLVKVDGEQIHLG